MHIYDKNTTDFGNNGYGFLRDALSASVTEVLNGEYSLSKSGKQRTHYHN